MSLVVGKTFDWSAFYILFIISFFVFQTNFLHGESIDLTSSSSVYLSDIVDVNPSTAMTDTMLIYKSDSVCHGIDAKVSVDLKHKIGPLSYSWNAIPSGTFVIYGGNTAAPTIPTSTLSGGTYQLKVVVTDHGVSPARVVADTVSFTIHRNPSFAINPVRDYCLDEGQALPITLFPEVGGYLGDAPRTYTWKCDRNQITSDADKEIVNTQVLLGCNAFSLRVTDAHGCTSIDSVELQGHHFDASISLDKQPKCLEYASLSTRAPHCAGCLCGECFRECGCSPLFRTTWGPSTLIFGNGETARTRDPMWQTIEVWVAIQDPAGCIDTSRITIPMSGCKEPEPELSLRAVNVCDYDVPYTIKATYKPGIGPVSFRWIAPLEWGVSTNSSINIPMGWTGCQDVTVEMTDHGLSVPKTVSATASICVYPSPPESVITPVSPTSCIGDQVTLSATNYGLPGFTYHWDSWGAPLHDQGNGMAISEITGAYNTYTLRVSSGNGMCFREFMTSIPGHEVQARISPLPGGFICGSMSGTLSGEGSVCSQHDAIVDYIWGPPAALVTTSGAHVQTHPITSPTTFTLEVRDAFGCHQSTNLTIGGGACDIQVRGDTVCVCSETQTVLAHPKVLVSGGNPQVIWRDLSGAGLVFSDSTSYSPTVSVCDLSPGDYPLEVIINDGVTTAVHASLIRVVSIPQVSLVSDSRIVCIGDTVRLTATVTGSTTNNRYYWLNGAMGKETDTIGYAIPGVTGPSIYRLRTESPYGCYVDNEVTINGLPRVLLCGNTECTGSQSYKGLISVLNGKPPYTFYEDAALTILVNGVAWNTSRTLATIPDLQSGQSYRFYVGGSRLCETSSVEVYKECSCYAGAYITTDSLGCGSSATSAKIRIQTFGAMFYSFQLLDPNGVAVLTAQREGRMSWEYSVPRSDAGLYKLVNLTGFVGATDVDGCPGDVYGRANVSFPEALSFTLSADKPVGCVNDTTVLSVNGLSPLVMHKWTTRGGGSVIYPDSIVTPAFIAADTNVFILTADAGNGCVEEKQIRVVGHRVTAGDITVAPGLKLVCDEVGTLTATEGECSDNNCALTYRWSPASRLTSTSNKSVTTTVLQEDTEFQVVVQDAVGCRDSSRIVLRSGICELKVNGDTLCVGNAIAHPSIVIKGGNPTVEWADESHAGLVFSDVHSAFPTIDISGLAQGVYPISVTVNDGGDKQVLRTSISVIGNPRVVLRADKTTVCVGEPVALDVTVTPISGKYTYYWLQGAVGEESDKTSTTIVAKKDRNSYLVKVEDALGCFGYDSVAVTGLVEAYVCAENFCDTKDVFNTLITLQNSAPPYIAYQDSLLTIPVPHAIWSGDGTEVSIGDLASDNAHTFYFNGNGLCKPIAITVTEHCDCGGTMTCEPVMTLMSDTVDCTMPLDSVKIYVQAQGATTFSFRLVDPTGVIVLEVIEGVGTEWVATVAADIIGSYRIEDFFGHTVGFAPCPGKVFGKVEVKPIEDITIDAGADLSICEGEEITLSATGSACDFRWNQGVVNGVPFTPLTAGMYVVEGRNLSGCKATDTVHVFINEAVRITGQSAHIVVERGLDASASVSTNSVAPIAFLWEHELNQSWHALTDGGQSPEISGSRTNQILLQRIPSGWNGTRLRCIVENECGSDTAYFTVSVTGCVKGGTVVLQMEEGITRNDTVNHVVDGWYCRGVRIGVRALVGGFDKNEKLTYHWTVDGIPVDYSDNEYISWIPAMWEDDIILKVCVYSPNLCEVVCAKYIRLKSKVFQRIEGRIVTSVDPDHLVCPGERVTLEAVGEGVDDSSYFQWQHDIFALGKGRKQLFTMTDKDVWIRLTATVSDKICTRDRVLEDSVHLKFKKIVHPSLRLLVSPDTIVCAGESVRIEALAEDVGQSAVFEWQADITNAGKGRILNHTMSDKDTWFACRMTPGKDVCYGGEPITAYSHVHILESEAKTIITSDMATRLPGEKIAFSAKGVGMKGEQEYKWYVNNGWQQNASSSAFVYTPKEGDLVKCCISGERPCQKQICSETIKVSYVSRSRDTLLTLRQGEVVQKLNIALPYDRNCIFAITERPQFGTAVLSLEGVLSYTPKKDFVGGDMLRYSVKEKSTRKVVAEGEVYITVSEQQRYHIPNIITPNGDGVNDYWKMDWIGDYPDNVVLIYSPKNRLVYSAVNYQNDFDGSYIESNGTRRLLPAGVYTYVISLKNKMEFKSWLEIRR